MNPFTMLTTAILSYLIGSISFARIVYRIWTGERVKDFKVAEDGGDDSVELIHFGANSVSSKLGAKGGFVVSVMDIIKIGLPVLIVNRMFPNQDWLPVITALFGMAGHIWPLYFKFRGGGGFSAVMGAMLVFDPLALLVTPIAGLVLGMLIVRNIAVATLSWMWLLIPWFLIRKPGNFPFIIYPIAANILFTLAMVPEIKIQMEQAKMGKKDEYGMQELSATPMGRGYLKMARKLGFVQEETFSKQDSGSDNEE